MQYFLVLSLLLQNVVTLILRFIGVLGDPLFLEVLHCLGQGQWYVLLVEVEGTCGLHLVHHLLGVLGDRLCKVLL